jgi:hypothetical protein
VPSQPHLRAINRTIRALNADENDLAAPLVEPCRDVARQMDDQTAERFSGRLAALYRQVHRELMRLQPPSEGVRVAELPAVTAVVPPSRLAELRASRQH